MSTGPLRRVTGTLGLVALVPIAVLLGMGSLAPEEAALRAVTLAGSRGERPNEAHARLLLGHVAAENPPGETAEPERHYRDALGLATDLGMRPLVAHCHLGLGKLYRRTDKREQAQEHLATATTMYREMGMTGRKRWRRSCEHSVDTVARVFATFPRVHRAPRLRYAAFPARVRRCAVLRCRPRCIGSPNRRRHCGHVSRAGARRRRTPVTGVTFDAFAIRRLPPWVAVTWRPRCSGSAKRRSHSGHRRRLRRFAPA